MGRLSEYSVETQKVTQLISPSKRPHQDVLTNSFGMSGIADLGVGQNPETVRDQILSKLSILTGSEKVSLEESTEDDTSNLWRFVLEKGTGSQISYHGKALITSKRTSDKVTMSLSVSIPWISVPSDVEKLVQTADGIWSLAAWRTLYGFDEDDVTIQNYNSPSGMEYYGIDPSQVRMDKDQMGWELIYTAENPGYMFNREGFIVSIQWLNYWSLDAQMRLFKKTVTEIQHLVGIVSLEHGAVRVRLSKTPGRFDDEAFHRLQINAKVYLPPLSSGRQTRGICL